MSVPVIYTTTVSFLPRIQTFLQACYKAPIDAQFINLDFLKWKYCSGLGKSVYTLDANGDITAHAGIWPTEFGAMQGACIIDWASAVRGAGPRLAMQLSTHYDFIYAWHMSPAARNAWKTLGFADYTKTWQCRSKAVKDVSYQNGFVFKELPRGERLVVWASPYIPCASDINACPLATIHTFAIIKYSTLHGVFKIAVIGDQARIIHVCPTSIDVLDVAYALALEAASNLPGIEQVYTEVPANKFDVLRSLGFQMAIGNTVMVLPQSYMRMREGLQFQLINDDSAFLQHENIVD